MSTCPNCGKKLSCGCQKTKASDGRLCCNSCVNAYNKNLRSKEANPKRSIKDLRVTVNRLDNL